MSVTVRVICDNQIGGPLRKLCYRGLIDFFDDRPPEIRGYSEVVDGVMKIKCDRRGCGVTYHIIGERLSEILKAHKGKMQRVPAGARSLNKGRPHQYAGPELWHEVKASAPQSYGRYRE